MSLENEFEKTWKKVSEEQHTIDDITDRKIREGINSKIRREKKIKKLYWTAAAVIPFFGLLILYYTFQKPATDIRQKYVYESRETPKAIKLSDGSVIKLMPYSKLTLNKDFGDKNREIEFTGQGNFSIAKDKTKPFRIDAGGFYVQVLGTHFFLDQKSEEKKVELFEGKVKVEHLGKVTYLLPKEIWISNSHQPDYHYYDKEKPMSFTFNHTDYSEAIQQLEEAYNVRISYPDEYRSKKVSGSFTGNLNDILSIISYPFNLKIEKLNEKEIQLK
ncbi:FecR family protein [Chryseobacterium sp.]|uniref:FecR family protein n=1 Tax=Chryseobacterium sp. TaxID=1871047 RepID=UPI00334118E7